MRQRPDPVGLLAAYAFIVALACMPVPGQGLRAETETRSFSRGLPTDPSFFPIAVWLQQPHNAGKFKGIGINTFVGLWDPLTAEALDLLDRHGVYLIVAQSDETLAFKESPVIRGWLQIDEPDNAQPDGAGGYGDCLAPEEIVRRYEEMRARDATRPVYLGFGQGVANPGWIGRGSKCAAIEPDVYYTAASRGADIVAFDIYPVAEANQPHVMGRLDLVGRGVRNLKRWAPAGVPVWADIETTHIKNPNRQPTTDEIRDEVWSAIINGATGINYFVHEWEPKFKEDGVFRYPRIVTELRRLNWQIQNLAPVLNAPSIENAITIDADGEIAHMVKEDAQTTYIFAVNMEQHPLRAKVTIGFKAAGPAVAVGEHRTIPLENGAFEDDFNRYQSRIYELQKK